MKYKGEIAGFPQEIVEKMLERQVEQGNKRDVSVFERTCTGGFFWDITIEGQLFWSSVIKNKNFDVFFAKYPKNQYPRVMMVRSTGITWKKRVVFAEKKGGFMSWIRAKTMADAENEVETCWWKYAKDVEPEPEQIELTIDEIAEKYGVKPEQIKIKK